MTKTQYKLEIYFSSVDALMSAIEFLRTRFPIEEMDGEFGNIIVHHYHYEVNDNKI